MAKLDAAIASGIIALGAAFAPAAFAEEAPQSLFPSAQTEQEAKNDRTSGAAKGHPVKVIFGSNFDAGDAEDMQLQLPECKITEHFSTDPKISEYILLQSSGGKRVAGNVGSAATQARNICLY